MLYHFHDERLMVTIRPHFLVIWHWPEVAACAAWRNAQELARLITAAMVLGHKIRFHLCAGAVR